MRRNAALVVIGLLALTIALPVSVVVLILATRNVAAAVFGAFVIFVGLITIVLRVAPRLLGELLDAQDRRRERNGPLR